MSASTPTPQEVPRILRAPNEVSIINGATIIDAALVAPDAGWVVTDRLMASTNALGVVESSLELPSLENELGVGVQTFVDLDHALVARADSTTGRVVVTGTDDRLATSFSTEIDAGYAHSQPLGIAFADPEHGWLTIADAGSEQAAGGRGALYATADGGRSFSRLGDDAPTPLGFVDDQTGWASGSGLFVTRDAGSTWTQSFPPNWDADGPAIGGPWYTLVVADADYAVVRQQAPTGNQAQLRFYATEDLGRTWRDITPPGTSEISNTGPQTWLAFPSAQHVIGIARGIAWITSSDAGQTYSSTALPFTGNGISMIDDDNGWIHNATELHHTTDGGTTWTQVATSIAAFDTEPECRWQLELAGSEGAGGAFLNWVLIRNLSNRPCKWPSVIQATASSLLDGTDIQLAHGDDSNEPTTPIDPGATVKVTFWSAVSYERCEAPSSTPLIDFRLEFDTGLTSPPIPITLEGACTISYTITHQP